MCSPTLAVMAVSTAMQAASQAQQGKAQASATLATANNNAQVLNFNANQQSIAAKAAVQTGSNEASIQRLQANKAVATGRAVMGSTGLLADTGSNLNIQGQNAGMGELNALTTMNNSEREAYGFKTGAQADQFQAATDKANAAYQAQIQRKNGLLAAGGTLITGAANFGTAGGFSPAAWKPTQGPALPFTPGTY